MKKKWVKAVVIAAVALVAAAGLAALTIWVILPAVKYSQAGKLADSSDYAAAYDVYDGLGDYRGAQARKDQLQTKIIESRTLGATMTFGGYEWLVLEQRNGKALLLMQDVLETRPYNESGMDTTWEACTLRMWLNGQFYEKFNEADRAKIVETDVVNNDNAQGDEGKVDGGGDTRDRVFLLSLAEAKLYFPDDMSRAASAADGRASSWWLRSPGSIPILACVVRFDGGVGDSGTPVSSNDRGVRPAMWITVG